MDQIYSVGGRGEFIGLEEEAREEAGFLLIGPLLAGERPPASVLILAIETLGAYFPPAYAPLFLRAYTRWAFFAPSNFWVMFWEVTACAFPPRAAGFNMHTEVCGTHSVSTGVGVVEVVVFFV